MVPHNRYPNDAGRRSLIFLIDSGPGFADGDILSGFLRFSLDCRFSAFRGDFGRPCFGAALFQFAVGWD
jgi:hypothetical protein